MYRGRDRGIVFYPFLLIFFSQSDAVFKICEHFLLNKYFVTFNPDSDFLCHILRIAILKGAAEKKGM